MTGIGWPLHRRRGHPIVFIGLPGLFMASLAPLNFRSQAGRFVLPVNFSSSVAICFHNPLYIQPSGLLYHSEALT